MPESREVGPRPLERSVFASRHRARPRWERLAAWGRRSPPRGSTCRSSLPIPVFAYLGLSTSHGHPPPASGAGCPPPVERVSDRALLNTPACCREPAGPPDASPAERVDSSPVNPRPGVGQRRAAPIRSAHAPPRRNGIGVLLPWRELQTSYDAFFSVVDLPALMVTHPVPRTTPRQARRIVPASSRLPPSSPGASGGLSPPASTPVGRTSHRSRGHRPPIGPSLPAVRRSVPANPPPDRRPFHVKHNPSCPLLIRSTPQERTPIRVPRRWCGRPAMRVQTRAVLGADGVPFTGEASSDGASSTHAHHSAGVSDGRGMTAPRMTRESRGR